MKNILKFAAAIAGLCALPTHADVTLNFELSGPDMQSSAKNVSISRFFARIDDPAEPDSFLLYQAGKFFPLYQVNTSAATYTLLTPEVKPTLHAGITPKPEKATTEEPTATEAASATDASAETEQADSTAAETATQTSKVVTELATVDKAADYTSETTQDKPKTSLRLTKQSKTIAGVQCRVVEELAGDQPVMTHCMAEKTHLGISERETRTLARIFEMARERGYGWLGTATTDEQFVSIASQDLQSNKTLQLKSHSSKPLPTGYLRVPREFKKVPNE